MQPIHFLGRVQGHRRGDRIDQSIAIADGCIIVDIEGDEKVLVRSDGTTTYIAKDLANAFWKLGIIDDKFGYKEFITQPNGSAIWFTTDKENGVSNFSFNGVERSITVIDSRQTRLQKISDIAKKY